MTFTCARCDKPFARKSCLVTHLTSCQQCIASSLHPDRPTAEQCLSDIRTPPTPAACVCQTCGKAYSHRSSLSRHRSLCAASQSNAHRPPTPETPDDAFSHQQPPSRRAYCQEDLAILADQDFGDDCLFADCDSHEGLANFVRGVWFSADRPQNHCIALYNRRNPLVHVWDGDRWTTADRAAVAERLVDMFCVFVRERHDAARKQRRIISNDFQAYADYICGVLDKRANPGAKRRLRKAAACAMFSGSVEIRPCKPRRGRRLTQSEIGCTA
jgi:hypothetical protein